MLTKFSIRQLLFFYRNRKFTIVFPQANQTLFCVSSNHFIFGILMLNIIHLRVGLPSDYHFWSDCELFQNTVQVLVCRDWGELRYISYNCQFWAVNRNMISHFTHRHYRDVTDISEVLTPFIRAVSISETPANLWQTIRRNIPLINGKRNIN